MRLRAGESILTLQEKLRVLARYEALTEIYNRGTILETLQQELSRGARDGSSVAVIMLDLDKFKHINDRHGHLAGDAVLREATRRIRAELRPYDALGRYGGEEFLVVLPGCRESSACEVAERVRRCLAADPIDSEAGYIPITASLGAAGTDKWPLYQPDRLIAVADAALYRAKRAGRNCVLAATELQPLTANGVNAGEWDRRGLLDAGGPGVSTPISSTR